MHVCSVSVHHAGAAHWPEESNICFRSTESADKKMSAGMFLRSLLSPLGGALWRKCFGIQCKYKFALKAKIIKPPNEIGQVLDFSMGTNIDIKCL